MVTTKKFGRVTAMLLALVMLLTLVPFQSFAAGVPAAADLTLKDGVTVALSSDMTEDQVEKALFDALVENPEGANYQDYEWEYECEGKLTPGLTWGNKGWGFVDGFNSKHLLSTYVHPALKDNQDDTWPVRLVQRDGDTIVSQSNEVTITKFLHSQL